MKSYKTKRSFFYKLKNAGLGFGLCAALACGAMNFGCGSDNHFLGYGYDVSQVYPSDSLEQNTDLPEKETEKPENCKNRYFEDRDGDGYGNMTTYICEPLPGYVEDNSDCDDDDQNNFPSNIEYCDGKDNNCNSEIDENLTRACETECGGGIEICVNGIWKGCTAPALGKEKKICKDNNVYPQGVCGNLGELVEECHEPQKCSNGKCVCVPNCDNKNCGDNGCGGICGECGTSSECNSATGRCKSCKNKECGLDAFGESCGECSSGTKCFEREYYNPSKCISKESDICYFSDTSSYEFPMGYCKPKYVCSDGGLCNKGCVAIECCPISHPVVNMWVEVDGPPEISTKKASLCCDKCYPYFNSLQEAYKKCLELEPNSMQH